MYKQYNMNQMILPLDLEIKLEKNDIAYAVNDLVEQIPCQAFDGFRRSTGCPAYHPKMMVKLILCAYTQSVFSGRKIEDLVKDSIRMMWLAQGYEPSYRTIDRKSTRLNSSHVAISYAVFCLKKKKIKHIKLRGSIKVIRDMRCDI